MKQIKTVAIIAFGMASCMLLSFTVHQGNASFMGKPAKLKVTWAKDMHDFGEIPQGKPVSIEFSFKNEGDEPLLVADVQTSCGCTASDYSKAPIAPGKSSKIKVTYNAVAVGEFSKKITVNFSDAALRKELNIKGTVK